MSRLARGEDASPSGSGAEGSDGDAPVAKRLRSGTNDAEASDPGLPSALAAASFPGADSGEHSRSRSPAVDRERRARGQRLLQRFEAFQGSWRHSWGWPLEVDGPCVSVL